MTPQETDPDLPVSVQESLAEAWSAVACCRVGDNEYSSANMGHFEGGPHYLHYLHHLKVKVKVAHSWLTLCNPMDYPVHGILQARILEWVAFPFSRGSSQCRDRTQVSALQAESPEVYQLK